LAVVQDLLAAQQRRFNEAIVGRTVPVLFEKEGRHSGQLVGRTPHMQSVHAAAPVRLIGRTVPVRLLACGRNSIAGAVATLDDADHTVAEDRFCA
jgi:tRNA-2-methylthio-N6-dimethylallyladenosine synthase